MSDGAHQGWHDSKEMTELHDGGKHPPREFQQAMKEGDFTKKGRELGILVEAKNKQYGDSFNKSFKILEALYPDGVKPHQYKDMLAIIRIIDKLFRIAQRKEDGQDPGGESPYNDVTGYGILGAVADDRRENENDS